MEKMFCFQCQETAKGSGCTVRGVCGKTPDVANLQDLLLFLLKGIAHYRVQLRALKAVDHSADQFILDGLFMTITNANFDRDRFIDKIKRALLLRARLKQTFLDKKGDIRNITFEGAYWQCDSTEEMEQKATTIGVLSTLNEDVRALRELLIYGIKGIAAYTEHAYNLGQENQNIYEFIDRGLVATTLNLSTEQLIQMVLECGKNGVDAMALLDQANTTAYGNPEITKVDIGVRNNPGILISGHDLRDLEELLKQTEGSGVDIYTHSEMLPAHYYPAFKKYKHFAGNYGNAWWRQVYEFQHFNGPILFTTNCLVPPHPDARYADRVYTTGSVGFPGFKYIPRNGNRPKDFSDIIAHAKKCLPPEAIETGSITGGFAHHQVIALADKIVEAVKSGKIRKFVVMSGCDGRMKSREYYTEFAQRLPQDTVILTSGCAKYRYNKLPLGEIDGIPRVLDAGQCNDSYSWIKVASKLKEIFGAKSINDLPIVFNIAWYEQKAVIVLLALLYLGIKNIHAGPSLPAFFSPNVLKVLVEKFGLSTISNVDDDLKQLINR